MTDDGDGGDGGADDDDDENDDVFYTLPTHCTRKSSDSNQGVASVWYQVSRPGASSIKARGRVSGIETRGRNQRGVVVELSFATFL